MNNTIFDLTTAAPQASGSPAWAMMFVVGIILLIIFIALTVVVRRAFSRPELHGLSREEIERQWEEIEKISGTGLMGAKMALIEADRLLDGALKSMMIPGDTMGERLKFAQYRYPELRKVWFAHRLRNQLVHEATFEVSIPQAKSAIAEFKRSLKALHVL
jgi:hypothetical protein